MAIPELLTRTVVNGGVAVIPTDTCYGLVADALNEQAVWRVLTVKGRPTSRPPATFVPDLSTIKRLATVSQRTLILLRRLLPGPYTVLLPASGFAPPWLLNNERLVGIRYVRFRAVRDLLNATGRLLTATSANKTGLVPPYTPDELEHVLPIDDIDYILTDRCGGLPPSTVIDMSTEPVVVLREGAVSKPALLEILQSEES